MKVFSCTTGFIWNCFQQIGVNDFVMTGKDKTVQNTFFPYCSTKILNLDQTKPFVANAFEILGLFYFDVLCLYLQHPLCLQQRVMLCIQLKDHMNQVNLDDFHHLGDHAVHYNSMSNILKLSIFLTPTQIVLIACNTKKNLRGSFKN